MRPRVHVSRIAGRRVMDRGVALILVMLSLLVLSVLTAAIIFTARAEIFASYNYKLDTQADYLAKGHTAGSSMVPEFALHDCFPKSGAHLLQRDVEWGAPESVYLQ